jgi:glyoxylase-like metal-dependent hydrolase (beta-lactamase superfamily II)
MRSPCRLSTLTASASAYLHFSQTPLPRSLTGHTWHAKHNFLAQEINCPISGRDSSIVMEAPDEPLPVLDIPTSTSTVSVSIIDTTAKVRGLTAKSYLEPPIPGHEYLAVPCFSFLVHHGASDRSLLFDLGIRRDWWNLSPPLLENIKEEGFQVSVLKDLRQILEEGGVNPSSIEAVIWSHYHFDHIGDLSRFDSSTALVVGPGFGQEMLPGYPADPEGIILQSDYTGRELHEINFEGEQGLRIGRFRAWDYFKDGSFYLLDAPGHTIGHLCGLARVTSSPDSFVMMGADAGNHGAEIRPSSYLSLPEDVQPNPFQPSLPTPCPGSIFESLLRDGNHKVPFYVAPADAHEDTEETIRTIRKLQDLDAHDNVIVMLAHDETLLGVVDFFPAKVDNFVQEGWVKQIRWRFLRDFAKAAGWQGPIEERGQDWGPL